ncbi:hypothetical protein R2Q81_10800 [Microbacterium aquimaris]|uniref:hypothetical protein n=1 Tax=Microbacterium aquimaris TaxID=459816 RepID=UPI002AD25A16|nr:hypothetical protein [Microbacterium aquimaris]MDZ8276433.1 hypothetical protein [Microbacterium aquimaris]
MCDTRAGRGRLSRATLHRLLWRRPTGLARFFDAGGRIAVYPSNPQLRAELLASVARSALEPGEVLSEKQTTAG